MHGYYPRAYFGPQMRPGYPALRAGTIGVMIGGAGAAARNIPAYRAGTMTRQEALSDTARTAFFAGAAAAAADVAARALGGNGVLPTAAAITTGAAVMYYLAKSANEKTGDEK
ncbi:hypothetical protein [Rhodobium gokarnense]|uniref:Uncharacterized protein n=1 Tax=Rhodobium gokarnense TaxID=364296 RepID=A0ABT3H972_9HYPH|nr:hypothetical protein [Rhodobium gokarnense]MCW2306962.1 hypothetical protein [Rhodobium gokarnense]